MLFQFQKAGSRRPFAATAGTVAPSHLLHKFGKLTIEFEMLCKKLKACSFKTSAGQGTADAGACGAVLSAPSKKNKAADGSLARYLCLIDFTLPSPVFSGS